MLIQPKKGVVPGVGVVVLLIILIALYSGGDYVSRSSSSVRDWANNRVGSWGGFGDNQEVYTPKEAVPKPQPKPKPKAKPHKASGQAISESHNEISSTSTKSGRYFNINFGDYQAMNPNIIPHPSLNETWIIVAQRYKNDTSNPTWFTELVCEARFNAGDLECIKSPLILPIPGTLSEKCEGDLSFFNFNIGPHDARVFFGPDRPYIIYGSQSSYNCFGQWMQDLRLLVDWAHVRTLDDPFRIPTDLQRPPPYGPIEKNWFPFWDADGEIYMHYDIAPERVFGKLGFDGSVGEDLAPLARNNDAKCLGEFMAPPDPDLPESIHQATNSLTVTMCKRGDTDCKLTDSNTFIFTIVQRKSYYDFHSEYEPYVVLFKRRSPFELHSISSKPVWIKGRKERLDLPTPSEESEDGQEERRPHTEMLYVTSMSWKAQGQRYHGYLDDELFIGFGIEDKDTGGIDVLASDLLEDLGLCSEL